MSKLLIFTDLCNLPEIELLRIQIAHIHSIEAWVKNLKEFQLDSIFETRILGRAYEYIDCVEFTDIQDNCIKASIKGSNLYDVILRLEDDLISGTCSCPFEGNCKHLAAVIINKKNIEF